jgi:hypothetical protein
MQREGVEDAEGVLAAALERPQAAGPVFASLGELPGVVFEPARPGRLWRAGTPARLHVGDFTFRLVGDATVEVQHTVRGIVLARTTLPPVGVAGPLAHALLDAVPPHGQQAAEALAVWLTAWAELLGVQR